MAKQNRDSIELAKLVRKDRREFGDELPTHPISNTLGVYKDSFGYHLQRIFITARPVGRDFALSSTNISLSQQYLLKYREALFALKHNLKFVVTAIKINDTIPVKSEKLDGSAYENTKIDLEYLHKTFKFNHSSLTLIHNGRKKNCVTVNLGENFNSTATLIIESSKEIIEDLYKVVDKRLLTAEDKKVKDQLYKIADTIVGDLKSNKMSLDVLKNEIVNAKNSGLAQ